MRYSEIFEAAPNIPQKYLIDDETDLALNLPSQWTQSPYLGAVKNPKGDGYIAQIHIPQEVWVRMVEQNPQKWSNAPESFFKSVGNQRIAMRVGFADPRQAAWFTQEVLYGGDHPPIEVFESFFDEKYNGGNGELWRSLKKQVPHFEGAPIASEDEAEYFANPEEFRKKAQIHKNTSAYYEKMPGKIKKALLDFFSRNQALFKKRTGQKPKSQNEMSSMIDALVDKLGIEHFVTGPGSVKMKDIASLTLA